MLFSSPSEAECKPDRPPAGLLTCASPSFDSPSQDASQWLEENCQSSQRLQLRGSDGFTPSSQHQNRKRLSRQHLGVKSLQIHDWIKRLLPFDKLSRSRSRIPDQIGYSHPTITIAQQPQSIERTCSRLQILHPLQMSHSILWKTSWPATHHSHLRLWQRP
jgi:hypothetical protein